MKPLIHYNYCYIISLGFLPNTRFHMTTTRTENRERERKIEKPLKLVKSRKIVTKEIIF